MIARSLPRLLAVLLLLLAIWGSFLWSTRTRSGADLVPARLRLRPGQRGEVRLLNYEPEIVAFSFRLRFDEAVVEVEAPPEEAKLLPGGDAIHMPVRRSPGLLEVEGVALTGGRSFKASSALYQFMVRGVGAGATPLALENLTLVDLSGELRVIPDGGARVTVTP